VVDPDLPLREWLVEFSTKRPRWGYRRAHRVALKAGFKVNLKKVHRIWKEEGLKVTRKARKRVRQGQTDVDPKQLRATGPDHVWGLDFQADQTTDGRQLRLLNIVDEFTREVLAIEVGRSMTADRTVEVIEELIEIRGTTPGYLRMDNGPELTADAVRECPVKCVRGWGKTM